MIKLIHMNKGGTDMQKYNIKSANIEFKNLFSGPAPVGRILNYIYSIGTTGLKHKNGNRTVYSSDGLGYAWTTEFMIGLGIAKLGEPVGSAIKLELTPNGKALFELMKDKSFSFDDGFRDSNILRVKAQINNCHTDLYDKFRQIFFESYPFLILKDYLSEKGYYFGNLRRFYDDFFSWSANIYGEGSEESNAGFNRIPSLIQLCKLFEVVDTKIGLKFDEEKIENSQALGFIKEYTEIELRQAATEERALIINSTKDLVSMYGEDGNVIVSAIVRNSSLQTKFKHNLTIQQKGKCVVCGMEHKELLIGSHIKSSATSDVVEKIDHNNGLLLCCNHDKLFDRYLITFDSNTGRIKFSKDLTVSDIKRLGLSDDFSLPAELLTEERQGYLKLHNAKYEEAENNRKHK